MDDNHPVRFGQFVQPTNYVLTTDLKGSVLEINEYGSQYYVIFDKSFYHPMMDDLALTFLSHDTTVAFPVSDLFETRHFMGSVALQQENRIVTCNFQYDGPCDANMRIAIFCVKTDFSCIMINEIFVDATPCAGGALDGNFISPKAGTFLLVWGDLSNNDFFSVGSLQLSAAGVEPAGVQKILRRKFPVYFMFLSDLYFAANGAVLYSRAFPVQPAQPNQLVLELYTTGKTFTTGLSMPFHRVAILPFLFEVSGEITSSVRQHKRVSDIDGESDLVLVEVSLKKQGARLPCAVVFLLQTPSVQILDMYTSLDQAAPCCIHCDNRSIARVRHTQGKYSYPMSLAFCSGTDGPWLVSPPESA